jgi:hypothetical protein
MALPSGPYAPRDPSASVLYQVVRNHYYTFRAEASQPREGEGLPHFVDDEFDAFLRYGWHARWIHGLSLHELPRGAARGLLLQARGPRRGSRVGGWNGRGFCPSCGGRCMTEREAHLMDQVWPKVPARQWVLTLPPRVR